MEQYNTEERELDLRDLFWKLLKSWRLILVWAVIFTVLLGAISYLRSEVPEQVSREELVEQLTSDEIRQLHETEDLRKQVESMEEAVDADPILSMNPYDITQTTMQFYISADSIVNEDGSVIRTYNEDLQAAYKARISDNDVREGLANLTGNISAEQIASYISVTANGSSSLQVSIMNESDGTCEKMADYVKEVLADYSVELQERIGAHEITLIAENTQRGYNSSIDSQRNARTDSLNSLKSKLEKKVEELSSAQLALYEYDEEQQEAGAAGGRSVSKKYLVLGFLIGAFLACVWVVLRYVLDGRIKVADDISQVLAGGYVGTIVNAEKRKKRFLGGIDSWLNRRQHRGQAGQTEEAQLELLASNIELLCKKNSLDTLYVTGSRMTAEGNVQLNKLVPMLKESGIQLEVGAAAAKDAASLEQMVQCGKVLLWEEANQSYYQEFVNLAALCRTQGVTVIGAVMAV